MSIALWPRHRTGGRRRRVVPWAIGLAVVVFGTGCAGGDGGRAVPDTAPVVDTTGAPPVTFADFASSLTARLGEEWEDPQLASVVVAGLDPGLRQQLEAKVPLAEVGTSPLLTYRPPTTDPAGIDTIVVFGFGNRVAEDGTITSGPMNEDLAATTAAFVRDHPMPVYAQWEVARILQAQGVPDVVSIEPQIAPDGTVTYLSTAGVADAVVAQAATAGRPLGVVGVIGFADHVGRTRLTAEAAGMDATVPSGVVMPSTYDPQSGQAWTRDRPSYLPVDLLGRLSLSSPAPSPRTPS